MLGQHYRAVAAALAALCSPEAVAQCSTLLSWVPPIENTDGSPLTDLAGYRAYWGSAQGNYPFSEEFLEPAATSRVIGGLSSGVNYIVLTAISAGGSSSAFSNIATKDCGGGQPKPPGPVRNASVVPAVPAAVTVTLSNFQTDNSPEFDLAITGAVTITLGADHVFDWCLVGAPQLGGNGGATAKTVAFPAPVTTRCDADGAQPFAGGTITAHGITKSLVRVGTTWTAQIP